MAKPQQILRVLVAEDPNDGMTNLVDFFRLRGFQSVHVADLGEVFEELKTAANHVVVLDLDYLGSHGENTIQQIRRNHGYRVGIVALSREGEQQKRVQSLNFGADIGLSRPVYLEELEALTWQIYQRLRLQQEQPDDSSSWTFYPDNGVLATASGRRIKLTGSEALIIWELAENCGKVVHRQRLLEVMMPGSTPEDTRRLDVLISRLKTKVRNQTGDGLSIRTFRNMGYALSDITVIE
jgi:DNA-binding response OmpR family regulator